jgi:hypothetical protein
MRGKLGEEGLGSGELGAQKGLARLEAAAKILV